MVAVESEIVTLRGGIVASLPALQLGWALEARGFRLSAANGRLLVQPHYALSDADILAIESHRVELLRLITYEPEAVA